MDTITSLADSFHEAALDPDLWNDAMARLGQALKNSCVTLSVFKPPKVPRIVASVGLDISIWELVRVEHGNPDANRHLRALQTAPVGSVVRPRDLMPESELLRDPVYLKFVRPMGFDDGMAVAFDHPKGGFASVGVFRKRHYDSEEVNFLRACAPHLTHSLRVAVRFSELKASLDEARAGLDAIEHALILTDPLGTAVHMNAAAKAMLAAADGLALRGGKITPAIRAEAAKLSTLIGTAARSANRGQQAGRREETIAPIGGALRVSRSSGRQAYSLLVTPLRVTQRHKLAITGMRAAVLICVSDPEIRPRLPTQLIAGSLGLTTAEATLVSHLVRGCDLKTAAELMSVTRNTAKTLLQRAFERTGTQRQSQLLALVLTGPLSIGQAWEAEPGQNGGSFG